MFIDSGKNDRRDKRGDLNPWVLHLQKLILELKWPLCLKLVMERCCFLAIPSSAIHVYINCCKLNLVVLSANLKNDLCSENT